MSEPVSILIVDDEKDVEQLFRMHLRKEIRSGKIELQFAFSAQDAIELLKSSHPPRVVYIFSDINMPGMSGLELLQFVKTEYPDIRVSMISAYGSEQYVSRAMDDGADRYFTKPIDFAAIAGKISELLATG